MLIYGVSFAVIILFFSIAACRRGNNIKDLNSRDHRLKWFYPGILILLDIRSRFIHNEPKEKAILETLHTGCNKQIIVRNFQCKKWAAMTLLLLLFIFFGFISGSVQRENEVLLEGQYIKRPSCEEMPVDVNISAIIRDGDRIYNEDITLNVEPQKYSSEELKNILLDAQEYLDKAVIGGNTSPDYITKPLNLIDRIPGTAIQIHWELDAQGIIRPDGTINMDKIAAQKKVINITASFIYGDVVVEYPIWIKVIPAMITWEELITEQLKTAISAAEKAGQDQAVIRLPLAAGGAQVSYIEKNKDKSYGAVVLGVFSALAAGIIINRHLEDQLKKRNLEMMLDYPEILNKYILLLGSGMTISQVFGRIVSEYQEKRRREIIKKRYAYEEMIFTWNEIKNGVVERTALESFGRRAGLLPYMKFASLLVQNIKKGSKDLTKLLELETLDAFQERKELARRLGEEAGTKLLLPMAIMLILVLIIIMVPAFISFGM